MRLKSILKLHQLSKNLGFVLALLLCLKDSLLSSFFAGKGFSEVADWLRADWLRVEFTAICAIA